MTERGTTYLEALREAQLEEMRRDDRVVAFGQDLISNLYGASGGFLEEFGPMRVRDAPISEAAITGVAVGAAMAGIRPIVDLAGASLVYCAMDQLVSQAAKNRYRFGGQWSVPVTYRAHMIHVRNVAAHHSDRPYPMLMGVPGLKIIAPTTPADAKGLLKSAIRTDDPVICFEDSSLWLNREEIPSGDHLVPLGVAAVRREGTDATIVAIAGAVRTSLLAADDLATEGISAEVIDPRSLVPMDWETIVASVEKTKKLVAVDAAHRTCSAASEIVATVAERLSSRTPARFARVTAPDVHVPYSPVLHERFFPSRESIRRAVRELM